MLVFYFPPEACKGLDGIMTVRLRAGTYAVVLGARGVLRALRVVNSWPLAENTQPGGGGAEVGRE